MAVYFIIENEDLEYPRIKIGLSKDPRNRIKSLQTGNSRKLALMGWIECSESESLEKSLHQKYQSCRVIGEWFEIQISDVLDELKYSGTSGFICTQKNAGEFLGCDKDGIPDFLPPWEWADTYSEEFCPECGCSCGVAYNSAIGFENCLHCGYIVN